MKTSASKLWIAIAMAMFCVINASAAQFEVRGVVVDTVDSKVEGLPGASCVIYNVKDTTNSVANFVTDASGAFKQRLATAGDYMLKITFVGMKRQIVNFSLSDAFPSSDLGKIEMTPGSETLGEVVVISRRPIVQANGEKVVYNMSEDAESKTNTLLDMLRKVPMVTVDAEDNIQVNGQSSFKVLVDGKENPMFSGNLSQVLKSIPASAANKIEVITEPGAKYDAEGLGGVLNIVTKGAETKMKDSYTANVRINGGSSNAGVGAYFRTMVGKVTASLNYGYSKGYDKRKSEVASVTNFYSGAANIMNGTQNSAGHNFQYGSFDMSWEPNDKNLFTVSANLNKGGGGNDFGLLQEMYAADNSLTSRYRRVGNSKWDWGSWSLSPSFQHTFGKEGHFISLSYLYNHGISKDDNIWNYYDMENSPMEYPCSKNVSDNPTNEHTVQLDYVNPFNGKHKLEVGGKGVFRRNMSNSEMLNGFVPGQYIPEKTVGEKLNQNQDVAAIYSSYTGTFGKWLLKGGVRYEHTNMAVKFIKGTTPDFSSTLNDVVPNAAISYNLAPASSLRLSYQMRISRPSVWELNPFRDESNPLYVSYGNPNLESARNNNVTLTYSNFKQAFGVNFSVGYTRSDNVINRYTYTEGVTQYTTYANMGHTQGLRFNGYLTLNFIKNLQASLYCSVDYNDYQFKEMNLSNSGWGSYWNTNLSYSLPKDFRIGAYGGFGTTQRGLQNKHSGFKYYGLSLTKKMLKEKRLELGITASNFLGKQKFNFDSWTTTSYTSLRTYIPGYRIGVSVSYRFGGNIKDVKKTGAKIVNDDVESSSSGGNKGATTE